ncbi:transcription-repair coupling factor [Thiorhodospira sibirica]|uniref:transcription-repair coupling factor n=1 Tax=Thiorhodospira sibirica TaxID=154347 RepID=UPI00022C4C9F|nr:transcription-repair coupling factor [Thiorhodospira sibirica]
MSHTYSPFHPPSTAQAKALQCWQGLSDTALALSLARSLQLAPRPMLIITADVQRAQSLQEAMQFFLADDESLPIERLADWETLPYDVFSPHENIVSQRLQCLSQLRHFVAGALIVPVSTLMQRLCPQDWLLGQCFALHCGQRLDQGRFRHTLTQAGYRLVQEVIEHGEFAVRGGIWDIFPMGSEQPLRIEWLDDQIDSMRFFDPQTQRSQAQTAGAGSATIDSIQLLPAHEFPLNKDAIEGFKQRYRQQFPGTVRDCVIYREVSEGRAPAGIEYYLPLFFEGLETLFDYLSAQTEMIRIGDIPTAAQAFADEIVRRYEQRAHDRLRPLLAPEQLYLSPEELSKALHTQRGIWIEAPSPPGDAKVCTFTRSPAPAVRLDQRLKNPAQALHEFLAQTPGRVLFCAASMGRREQLHMLLSGTGIATQTVANWPEFLRGSVRYGLTIAPLEQALSVAASCRGRDVEATPERCRHDADEETLTIITETCLSGERVSQQRRRSRHTPDADALIRNLNDLHLQDPVVHEEYGVGRYLGLQTLAIGGQTQEFLTLAYAGGDKIYVPVASLHLISRYSGADPAQAPLHKLGTEQWVRAKRKAAEKAYDVAAELLAIHAKRAATPGQACVLDADAYQRFAAAFPFEETADQQQAIEAVMADLTAKQPMDRVICGDVGFGKTEVAMRAAFIAVHAGRQVAVLVPTTLLAEQHQQNFQDRFADWPVRIEALSRFRSPKQQQSILQAVQEGQVDILIGTHRLLQKDVRFKQLGLVIVDEEQRFGVRDKERLKALRAEVDMLTLTATPIPRTLNMALAGLRDLSIIATPPTERLAIKTFISEWNDALIEEAILRELRRGGQVYFLHNSVQTINTMAERLRQMIPAASIGIAHGQLSERELERVMLDFHHRRYNLLVCTTIIESGIDIPTANTIIIHRADKLGLAQLHQLRGRVGRSHHRAYAYLLTPAPKAMTPDAVKRLEALAALEDLGIGFTLASHDLEIRGAGELLGDEQSGQMHEIGFSLYHELLERAVRTLKAGGELDTMLDAPTQQATEVDLGIPALLPDTYVADVHTRLILYKRLASCADEAALREMQVEMIDRFGLLPEPAKHLIEVTRIKLLAKTLGIRKLETGPHSGRLVFIPQPPVDPLKIIQLVQKDPSRYRLDGQDTLRFTRPMPEAHNRIQTVITLLSELTNH